MAATDYTPDSPASIPESSPSSLQNGGFHQALGRLSARFNQRQMIEALVRALAVGLTLCAVLLLLHRLYLADLTPTVFIAILAACLVIGWRNGSLNKSNSFRAALDADRALGLSDRLSSAAAFAFPGEVTRARRVRHTGRAAKLKDLLFPRYIQSAAHVSAPTALVPELLRDAAARAAALDAKAVYPMRAGRAAKVAAGALVLLIAFALMPNIDVLRTPEQKAFGALLNKNGKQLEEVAKRGLAKKDEGDETTKKLAKKMEKLGQKMQRGRMTKREALTSMGELRKELENNKQDGRNQNGGSLEKVEQGLAGNEMESPEGQELKKELLRQDSDAQQKAEAAAKALEKLADKMEKGQLSKQEKEQAARDLKKAAEALRKAGGQQNEQAAKNLEKAAQALKQQAQNEGQKQGGQNGQQGQKGGQQSQKSGDQKSQQQGGQNGQQGQQGQKQGQNGQQQGNQQGQKQGQQGQQGGSQGSPGQGEGQSSQGGANALRNAARDLRDSASGGSSGSASEMLDKLREAENDTGQNGGENSGQGSQGQLGEGGNCPGGNCNGQNGGTKFAPSDPHGNVDGGAGLGPRNNTTGRNSGGGVSKFKGAKSGDKRRWEDVWSDRIPQTKKELSRINGKMGSGGKMERIPIRSEAKGGPVNTPYYDVYESYRKDAEDAVSRDAVPPAYKAPVKSYFDSIKPTNP